MRLVASLLLQSSVTSAIDFEESYHYTQLLQSKLHQGRVGIEVNDGGQLRSIDNTTLFQHSIDLSVMGKALSQKAKRRLVKKFKKDLCGDPELYINGVVDFGDRETTCDKILHEEDGWIFDEMRENRNQLPDYRKQNFASCCRHDQEEGEIDEWAFKRDLCGDPEMYVNGNVDFDGDRETTCDKILHEEGGWIYNEMRENGGHLPEVWWGSFASCCKNEPALTQMRNVANTNIKLPLAKLALALEKGSDMKKRALATKKGSNMKMASAITKSLNTKRMKSLSMTVSNTTAMQSAK